jgi:alkane 1-monooxygenase
MLRDWKYITPFFLLSLPFLGLYEGGYFTYLTPLVVFGIVPILELFTPGEEKNLSAEEEQKALGNPVYDFLLYLNLPLLYGVLGYFLYKVSLGEMSTWEWVGNLVSTGIVCGTAGINIGHELGHRKPVFDKIMAQLLLLGSLYMHFFIEHNRGHHKHVATPKDPASARLGQSLYAFWVRSMVGGYVSAWKIEGERLKKLGKPFFSFQNLMLTFQVIQVLAVVSVGWILGWQAGVSFILAALFGVLLLETVNYLEHYGLSRKQLPSGAYEPVKPSHSWNSNHSLGRILLFELTRHSDHHYKASRKYQILRHHEASPELPTGYPGMIALALVPPLWFRVMNKRLEVYTESANSPVKTKVAGPQRKTSSLSEPA